MGEVKAGIFGDAKIRIIAIISIVIGVALAVVSLFIDGGKHTSGVVAGAAIGTLNFVFLVVLMRAVFGEERASKGVMALRFVLKYFLVAGLILLAVFLLKVSPLGFAAGVSNIVVAALVGGLVPTPKEEP